MRRRKSAFYHRHVTDLASRLDNARLLIFFHLLRPCKISASLVRCLAYVYIFAQSSHPRSSCFACSLCSPAIFPVLSFSLFPSRRSYPRACAFPHHTHTFVSKLYRAQGQRVFVGTSRPNHPWALHTHTYTRVRAKEEHRLPFTEKHVCHDGEFRTCHG